MLKLLCIILLFFNTVKIKNCNNNNNNNNDEETNKWNFLKSVNFLLNFFYKFTF